MIDQSLLKKIKKKTILVDTNLLLYYLRYKQEYYPLLEGFETNDISLVTISPVKIEYYKGTNTNSQLKAKRELYRKTFDMTYPILDDIVKETFKISLAYRDLAKSASSTDLLLAGTLKRFGSKLILLTRNHKDFPTTIFNRVGIINIELERSIHSYSLIQFSQTKYEKRIKAFNKSN